MLGAPRRVTVVSGLPRSGTSLLMQMLEAAGLSLARDEERAADPDNPRGYHELAAVKRIRSDASFLADCRGRVVKVVAPLVAELPDGYAYRVLFMERAIDEVLASQRAMLGRRGGPVAVETEAALARAFEGALARARSWLAARPSIEVLFVDHRSLVARPTTAIDRIVGFLARTGDERVAEASLPAVLTALAPVRAAMVRVVDPALHRHRTGSRGSLP